MPFFRFHESRSLIDPVSGTLVKVVGSCSTHAAFTSPPPPSFALAPVEVISLDQDLMFRETEWSIGSYSSSAYEPI